MKILVNRLKHLNKKDRGILKNVVCAFGVKGAGLLVSFFTMPAYLSFFRNETVLGLWFTLLSVLSWVLNFDLGVGNGLRNHLTQALARGQEEEGRRYLSSAYAAIGLLCLLAAAAFLPLCLGQDWNGFFHIPVETVSADALRLTIGIVFAGILLQLFLKLISSVLYAMQLSFVNDCLSLCTSVLTLLAVISIPSGAQDRNLIVMALIHAIAVALPLAVCSVCIFLRADMCRLRPALREIRITHAKKVLTLGGRFFFVQVAYMLIMSTNEYLITALSGTEYVVEYQVYSRIFLLGGTLFSLALTPVWSAVTGAMAEKDYRWVRILYRKLRLFAAVATVCQFAVLPALPVLLEIWLGQEMIRVDWTAAFWMAALGTAVIWNSVVSSIANGLGALKTQMLCFSFGAVGKFILAWLLCAQAGSWTAVAAANVLVLLPYCLIQHYTLEAFFQKQEVSHE